MVAAQMQQARNHLLLQPAAQPVLLAGEIRRGVDIQLRRQLAKSGSRRLSGSTS